MFLSIQTKNHSVLARHVCSVVCLQINAQIVASFSQKEHTGVALARTSADVFVEESLRISLKNDGATETTASSVHVRLVSTTAVRAALRFDLPIPKGCVVVLLLG